jgi:hypothetical protein
MTYYEMLIKLAQKDYSKIHIDLKNKTLKVSKQLLIENGNIIQSKVIVADDAYECNELVSDCLDVNELYEQYKYSMPSERDSGNHYFKALAPSLLTDEQLIYGMPRLEARVRLEAYVMLGSLAGLIKWENDNHWFWQSSKDKDFVILKSWM